MARTEGAGAKAAYRGYRLQALYIFSRLLSDPDSPEHLYHLEGREDLDIIWGDGRTELIQVKAYSDPLKFSQLSSFFSRSFSAIKAELSQQISIILVSYGHLGPELSEALALNGKTRNTIIQKLSSSLEITDEEAGEFLNQIEVISVSEEALRKEVESRLRQTFTGIDPETAFDLVTYWLYQIAEQKGQITKFLLSERLNKAGRFIAERAAYYREWFTNIEPIVDVEVDIERIPQLESEYFSGATARYEHVLSGLDIERHSALKAIDAAFQEKSAVILHAASGKGKTTVALRYLHDYYPSGWRFRVNVIEGRAHAGSIARALKGHAHALDVPVIVLIEVAPRDIGWIDLVSRLIEQKDIKVLITIREEDWRRATSLAELDFASVHLDLAEEEARHIFEVLTSRGLNQHFISFAELWSRLGARGPMLEFIHYVTQGTTLREKLRDQITRLEDETREGKLKSNELEFLRMIAIASSFGARLRLEDTVEKLNLEVPRRTIELFEQEYLIRAGEEFVEGLHPLRSEIMARLLSDDGSVSRLTQVVESCLEMLATGDLEVFLLHAFSRHPDISAALIQSLQSLIELNWLDTLGVVRSLLWLGLHSYLEENEMLIREVHNFKGEGWPFILDADVAGINPPGSPSGLAEMPDSLVSPDAKAEIRAWRSRQSDKDIIFNDLRNWAKAQSAPSAPVSSSDWTSVAEACYWVGRSGIDWPLQEWLAAESITEAAETQDLDGMCELYWVLINQGYDSKHLQGARDVLLEGLKNEAHTVLIEESEDNVTGHFLLTAQQLEKAGAQEINAAHQEAIRHIYMLCQLYPDKSSYGIKGYGHLFTRGQIDESEKRITREKIFPKWLPAFNSTFIGMVSLLFRPPVWLDYCQIVDGFRNRVVDAAESLNSAMTTYFRNPRVRQIIDNIISDEVFETAKYSLPLLPIAAVDEWGMVHEMQARRPGGSGTTASQEADLSRATWAAAMTEYDRFRKRLSDFESHFTNFLNQFSHLLVLNPLLGRAESFNEKDRLIKEASKKGISPNGNLVNWNLSYVLKNLPRFQNEIRPLMMQFLGDRNQLEMLERENLSLLWCFVQQMDLNPEQIMNKPPLRVRAHTEGIAEDLIQDLINAAEEELSGEGELRVLAGHDQPWYVSSPLCLGVNTQKPIATYEQLESVVSAVSEVINRIQGDEELINQRTRILRLHWSAVLVIPLVKGNLFYEHCFQVDTITAKATITLISQQILPDLGVPLLDLPSLEGIRKLWLKTLEMKIIAAHIIDLKRLPELDEGSMVPVQKYVNTAANNISESLQDSLDLATITINQINSLDEETLQKHPELLSVIGGLRDWFQLISIGEENEAVFNLTQLHEWASNLENATEIAFEVLLNWATYILSKE